MRLNYRNLSLPKPPGRPAVTLLFFASLLVLANYSDAAPNSKDKRNKATTPTTQISSTPTEILLDGVIASVDEKPITLKELQARLSPPRSLSLSQINSDQEAQQALEVLIQERTLEAEASLKKLTVTDFEVEEYINEVATRNSLSRQDFEGVLAREGKNINWYKHTVKNEIYKSKLASSIAKGGISVSDQEIDEYLETNPSFKGEGASLKLRMITIAASERSADAVANRVNAVESALTTGKKFEDVAREFSDDPYKMEGGLLGVLAEADLSPEIASAVLSIEAGKYSKPVVNEGTSTQLFFVEERYGAKGQSDSDEEGDAQARREEARKAIQKRKTEEKLAAYFGVELQKNHTVDKKF